MLDPSEGEMSRRTAFVRNNGSLTVKGKQVPSFTIISNRCAHLGCPVQANGPTGSFIGLKTITETGKNGKVTLCPSSRPGSAARATAVSTTRRATAPQGRPCAASTATTSRSTTAASSF